MSGQWHGGKGSRRRTKANDKQYRANWGRIFGNDGDSLNGEGQEKERR